MESKENIIIGLLIGSTVLSSIFSIIMLALTIKHDQKVTGRRFR
ncbi:hypothetical protein SAMN05192534_1329 [Alteribacillus persepolensis]|uniref:Uncharacterized protein n=1 Tax=Alteribacillus persepolensis TaxID=568899 RepID=A0A1G8JE30_9BACI|nr:hypothetical protein [Alteribacillus persepolensis]SDI29554.1 hypothetical protein SAMN05192534_1329 [Alteribacillus persepolensis]